MQRVLLTLFKGLIRRGLDHPLGWVWKCCKYDYGQKIESGQYQALLLCPFKEAWGKARRGWMRVSENFVHFEPFLSLFCSDPVAIWSLLLGPNSLVPTWSLWACSTSPAHNAVSLMHSKWLAEIWFNAIKYAEGKQKKMDFYCKMGKHKAISYLNCTAVT